MPFEQKSFTALRLRVWHNGGMSSFRYMLSSLWHYRRVHLAVLAGVVVATAVVTGALLVGDSVRGSLRDLTLERLGEIDSVLVAEQPFREALADQFAALTEVAPLLRVPGSLTAKSEDRSRHATGLSVLGCTPEFWQFDRSPPPYPVGWQSGCHRRVFGKRTWHHGGQRSSAARAAGKQLARRQYPRREERNHDIAAHECCRRAARPWAGRLLPTTKSNNRRAIYSCHSGRSKTCLTCLRGSMP